jgi:hypothetical protein
MFPATLGSGGGKPFLGPLGDQVPLDLREQTEQGDHNLGLQSHGLSRKITGILVVRYSPANTLK